MIGGGGGFVDGLSELTALCGDFATALAVDTIPVENFSDSMFHAVGGAVNSGVLLAFLFVFDAFAGCGDGASIGRAGVPLEAVTRHGWASRGDGICATKGTVPDGQVGPDVG